MTICDNYLTVQRDILETFVDRGQLRKLAEPTVLPSGKRIPGLKLDKPTTTGADAALVSLRAARSSFARFDKPCERFRTARVDRRGLLW
jgi:hypothetical protein